MLLTFQQSQKLKKKKNARFLNDGSQTNVFQCQSKIVIYCGNRGCGKTDLILMKALPHLDNPQYNAVYLRREVRDAAGVGGIADSSKKIFGQFGTYLSSQANMTWNMTSGARLSFVNYSAPLDIFSNQVQGKNFGSIYVDEITQLSMDKFDVIFATLRNSYGLNGQIFATCNSDSSSWIAQLISRWLDPETGFHRKDMNGKQLYFFQFGDTISDSVWGETREECYELAKEYIEPYWDENMSKYNSPMDCCISISIFEGRLSENPYLTGEGKGGGDYMAALLKGGTKLKQSNARCCWKPVDMGDSLISESAMRRFFDNSPQTNGIKYASLDVAAGGVDKAVLWIFDGCHITNCYMSDKLDAKQLRDWLTRKLNIENVLNKNFAYDSIGVGFALNGYFEGSTPFVSNAKVSEASKVDGADGARIKIFSNAKAEVVSKFLDVLKDNNGTGECGISIEPELLERTFYGQTLREHLMSERRAIRWRDDREGVLQIIDRKMTKSIISHSADVILALIYRFALDIGKQTPFKPMPKTQLRTLHNLLIRR